MFFGGGCLFLWVEIRCLIWGAWKIGLVVWLLLILLRGRNWEDEVGCLLLGGGAWLGRIFGRWRRGMVMAYAGCCVEANLGGTLFDGGCCAAVCFAGLGAELNRGRPGSTSRFRDRESHRGMFVVADRAAFGFRGEFPRLEEGSGRLGVDLRGRKTEIGRVSAQ